MVQGKELIELAETRIGAKYVFGAEVDLDDQDWGMPGSENQFWDCAEFCSWVVKQITKRIYGALNPRSDNPDPWTGAWYADMMAGNVIQVTVGRAIRTPGALLLRRSKGGGHIAFSDGKGGTVEAMGEQWGVVRGKANGRGFQWGILVPGICYEEVA
jgi:hypothetical protein